MGQLTHNVRVGVDWGTLPQAQRQRWIALDCNRVVNSNATKKKDPAPSVSCNMETVASQLCKSEWDNVRNCDNALQTINDGLKYLLKKVNTNDYEDKPQCQLNGGASAWQVTCNMETVATQLCQSEWQSNGYSGRCDNALQTIYLGFDFLLKNFNSDDYEDSAQCRLSGGECKSMQLTHNVRVGVDWGTLPQAQRQRWIELDCNRVVNSNA